MFDCHCDVYVFRDRILVSDYDAADEIQSECARVEDGHQSYVKVIFQPSSLTDYAAAGPRFHKRFNSGLSYAIPRPHLLCEAEVEGFSHCVVHAYGNGWKVVPSLRTCGRR